MEGNAEGIRIFVYGTLKRGCSNHEAYCRGALSVEVGSVRGILHAFPCGTPVLVVPDEDILATGSANPFADAATQNRIENSMAHGDKNGFEVARVPGRWRRIRGEIFTFDDPQSRFALLDALEEFTPNEPSPYIRVLLPIHLDDTMLCTGWVYVCGCYTRGLEPLDLESWLC